MRDGSIPFSYLDNKKRYIGYSVDLCMKVVDAVLTGGQAYTAPGRNPQLAVRHPQLQKNLERTRR